jgi:hypothetical protein
MKCALEGEGGFEKTGTYPRGTNGSICVISFGMWTVATFQINASSISPYS